MAARNLTAKAVQQLPRFLNATDSAAIDVDLMGPEYGFSVDQLMELAGLAVAHVCFRQHPPATNESRVLVCVGPGNNGGDGLVAARHLKHFGYQPTIVYPKQPAKPLYQSLVRQCRMLDIPVGDDVTSVGHSDQRWDLIIDALFGFGFRGPPREPFPELLKSEGGTPVLSVDVPSGWDVDGAPSDCDAIYPTTLVSLTAPKLCAVHHKGTHWLGGRFVPPKLAEKYELNLPDFPGAEGIVRLSGL